MSTWTHIATVRLVTQHRRGWWGVWDALKAAVTDDQRIVVQEPMTLEMWIDKKVDGAVLRKNLLDGTTEGLDVALGETETYIDSIKVTGA